MPFPALADVVSKGPEAVAITIYRDRPASAADLRGEGWDDTRGLAMVSESREVDLPAGRTRIDFQGVADAIIPASARLGGVPVVERNFDYQLLDPGSLIDKSVGGGVTLRRTNPKTGQVTLEPATLRSGPDGVVVLTASGAVEALGCGTGPQALIFDHLPEGLADKPTLSVLADAPRAGHYKLTLSYLAVRIDWSADYVARLGPDGRTLDLTGWLTLSNRGATSFGDAPTEVVAGHLNRLPADLPIIEPAEVEPECWPMGTTTSGLAAREEALRGEMAESNTAAMPVAAPRFGMLGGFAKAQDVVAEKRVVVTDLGEYKLYTLGEPTTVAANETKQIRFLHQPKVRFETLYVWKVDSPGNGDTEGVAPATATLSLTNKDADGLGLPLPAGKVSVRQPQAIAGGRELFLGEPSLRDVPLNEPFELKVGKASDVEVRQRTISVTSLGSGAHHVDRFGMAFELTNAKPAPVTLEVRQARDAPGYRVVEESQPHGLKNGADVWRVTLPANSETTLTYTVERDE